MLFPSDKLHVAFRQIKKTSGHNGLSTLILATLEPDSVCASKLLAEALKSENILYTLRAVKGLSDLDRVLRPLLETACFKNIILINCGGSIDLTARFENLLEGCYLYIIDSRRPFSHKNLSSSSNRVVVFALDVVLDETIPETDDEGDRLDSSSEADDSDEEGENNEQNTQPEIQEEELFGGENTRELLPSLSNSPKKSPSKHSLKTLSPNTKKRVRKDRHTRVTQYYQHTYFGHPASHVVYHLIQQLGKENNVGTWMAIVGVTSRYINCDISDEHYFDLVNFYKQIVLDRNSTTKKFRPSMDDGVTSIPSTSKDHIDFVPEEIRLAMYRHWSFFEACYNSEYFASKFGAWNTEFSGNLEFFFVNLGLSLKDAQQKFCFMQKQSKTRVQQTISQVAKEKFNYDRMTFPSFIFRSGFDKENSAEDVARCISALLDVCESAFSEEAWHQHENSSNSSSSLEEESFTLACELLSRANPSITLKSQSLCLKNLKLLTSETIAIVKGGVIQNAGVFRFAKIDLHEEEDDHEVHETARTAFFSSVSSVVELAKHVVSANQGNNKWVSNTSNSTLLPFVLVVTRKRKAIVVGLPCPPNVGLVVVNPLGRLFAKTAKKMNLEIDPEYFVDAHILKMDEDEVQRFLLTLHETIFEKISSTESD